MPFSVANEPSQAEPVFGSKQAEPGLLGSVKDKLSPGFYMGYWLLLILSSLSNCANSTTIRDKTSGTKPILHLKDQTFPVNISVITHFYIKFLTRSVNYD
jgi:hypothetical protein